jgi:DNA polymerase III epsilon subunit family exonuclease
MTGLDPVRDRICEVAIVRGVPGQVAKTYSTLVRPQVPMTPGAREVHGITDEMLFGAPTFDEVADEVSRWLDGAVVVGHHVSFDLAFLEAALKRTGRAVPAWESVDTLTIARRLFAFRRNNLGSVCKALGVVLHDAHRALGDAMATWEVYQSMLQLLDPDGTVLLSELRSLIEALAPGSAFRMRQQTVLREAYRNQQSVWIEYPSGSDDKYDFLRREIGIWKFRIPRIQGWCFLREGERVFRIDRIRRVGLGERRIDIPKFKARI